MIGAIAVLMFTAIVLVVAMIRGIDIIGVFTEGVRDGFMTIYRIAPPLILMLTAIAVFKASGALDLIIYAVSPAAEFVGIPPEAVPLAVMRPFSGSGTLAMLEELILRYGPDSRAASVGAVLCASTETTFYTLSVYLSGTSGKCGRIILCAVLADFAVVLLTGLFVH